RLPGRLTGSAARTDVALFRHRAARPPRTARTPASASRASNLGGLRSHTPHEGLYFASPHG
ncbi:MAG: hypothetical protein KBH05_11745, partial [Nitrospira sp.]|nr:hypothetical protein [Nitrospira sp.]MBP8827142.1 hypothetical protein [Nitrospira sp.]